MNQSHETQKAKYGGEEGWRQHMREIAALGGSKRVKKGFAFMPKKKFKEITRQGGKSYTTKEQK